MSGMKRRIFIVLLVSAAVAWPLAARGQQPVIPVIGYFSGGSPDAEAPLRAPFLKALAESGFHEADQALRLGHVYLIRVFAGRLDDRRPAVDLACERTLRGFWRRLVRGHRLGADFAEALHQIGIF
jgi:hypothetical protein